MRTIALLTNNALRDFLLFSHLDLASQAGISVFRYPDPIPHQP
jgi:hypothetical protein